MEGFIEDLHAEAARFLLGNKISDVNPLIRAAHDAFRNPTPAQIERLFSSIGMPGILDGLRWQKASNETVRRRLNEYIELRNRIAHVESFKWFLEIFAEKFDAKVGREIASLTQSTPW